MPRSTAFRLVSLACAYAAVAGGGPLAAQTLADPIVAPAHVRLSAQGWFSYADERFGPDGDGQPLGATLTVPSAALLFPGAADLRERLAAALAGDASAFPLRLGATAAAIRTNEIRVPLSVDVGVLDRLTVGVTVPLVKTRVEGTTEIFAEAGADLGVNPSIVNQPLVDAFVISMQTRAQDADLLASDRCAADPTSQGCLDAQALASDLVGAAAAFARLYGTSVLFPAVETAAGTALTDRVAGLEERLAAEGLDELADLPLAAAPLDQEGFATLLTDLAGPYGFLAPPGTLGGVWWLGDVEARVAVRLIEGREVDEDGRPTGRAWSLAALGGVRLPTAAPRQPDALFLPPPDDGQLDFFAGAYGAFVLPRLAVRSRALYTRQQPGTVVDRVAPPDEPLPGASNRTRLDWNPGDELEIEVQPAFRIAPALSLGLVWRYVRHGEDVYTRLDPTPNAPGVIHVPVTPTYDASTLALGTEAALHEVGGSLTLRTLGLPGTDGGGFEVYAEVRRTVAGHGLRAPVATRAAFGGRAAFRLWGN